MNYNLSGFSGVQAFWRPFGFQGFLVFLSISDQAVQTSEGCGCATRYRCTDCHCARQLLPAFGWKHRYDTARARFQTASHLVPISQHHIIQPEILTSERSLALYCLVVSISHTHK